MREQLTVVTRKGQITVPVELRRAWGLKVGDKIAISDPDEVTGAATLRPVRSVAELTFGALSTERRGYELGEVRQAFADSAAERDAASRGATREGAARTGKAGRGPKAHRP